MGGGEGQAGRSVANLISEINGAARHAEATNTAMYALQDISPTLKTLALCTRCIILCASVRVEAYR